MVTEARRAAQRRYYVANRERLLAQSKARYDANPLAKALNASKRRQLLRAFIREQKEGKTCARCGFSDPRALQFHHRDPALKEVTVGVVWAKGWSVERIAAEIAKCEILCANCHSILHAEERDGPPRGSNAACHHCRGERARNVRLAPSRPAAARLRGAAPVRGRCGGAQG
jgi:hypothetical protein